MVDKYYLFLKIGLKRKNIYIFFFNGFTEWGLALDNQGVLLVNISFGGKRLFLLKPEIDLKKHTQMMNNIWKSDSNYNPRDQTKIVQEHRIMCNQENTVKLYWYCKATISILSHLHKLLGKDDLIWPSVQMRVYRLNTTFWKSFNALHYFFFLLKVRHAFLFFFNLWRPRWAF